MVRPTVVQAVSGDLAAVLDLMNSALVNRYAPAMKTLLRDAIKYRWSDVVTSVTRTLREAHERVNLSTVLRARCGRDEVRQVSSVPSGASTTASTKSASMSPVLRTRSYLSKLSLR